MKRIPIRAIALLLFVFLLGSFCGAGFLAINIRNAMQKVARVEEPPAGIRKVFGRLNRQLTRQLDLSPSESAAVQGELEITMERLSGIRVETFDSIEREARDSLQRIGKHLPADKEEKLRELAKKRLGPWGLVGPSSGDE